MVGIPFDGKYEPHSVESRIYIDIDEDDESSSKSSTLGKIFFSMTTLFFSILRLLTLGFVINLNPFFGGRNLGFQQHLVLTQFPTQIIFMCINLCESNLLQIFFKLSLRTMPLKNNLFEYEGGQNTKFFFSLLKVFNLINPCG
jgi:hypothetical protein